VRRFSIRLRLSLAFALAMAIVLTAVGWLLYVRLGESLTEQLDHSLEVQAETLAAVVMQRGLDVTDRNLTGSDERFAQVLRSDGSVLASSRSVAGEPVATRSEVARARDRSELFLIHDNLAALDGESGRLLLRPVDVQGGKLVLLVGASLEDRGDALEGLLAQLFVVGPLALLAASTAGYFLAAAALRPVEAMRRRAAEVSSDQPGQRLPLPNANDEVRRLGETLNAMLERLEAGLARERRFVADASHELRTPLALLKTELELALRRPRSSDELEEALRSAAEEVDRLTRLAEDLLVLAQVDEGKLPLGPTRLSVSEVLNAVAHRFEARAAALGRALEVRVTGEDAILADRLRLEQALGNVVDNALRHGDGSITLEAETRDDCIELRVRDEGSGFPRDFMPRAFDRFTRAEEARSGGGAGLGLAIVDAVARAHGGLAHVANGPGGGAVVCLSVPLA
jgi:two-component system OmpR family sensor kinase